MPNAPAFDPTAALDAAAAGQQQDNDIAINAAGGSTVRAFVVASEVTNQQEADARINELARL